MEKVLLEVRCASCYRRWEESLNGLAISCIPLSGYLGSKEEAISMGSDWHKAGLSNLRSARSRHAVCFIFFMSQSVALDFYSSY